MSPAWPVWFSIGMHARDHLMACFSGPGRLHQLGCVFVTAGGTPGVTVYAVGGPVFLVPYLACLPPLV